MSRLAVYLTFNGDCRKAMTFYRDCFGGELYFQTMSESPMSKELPKWMKDYILHSSLQASNMLLMGTDMVGEEGLTRGNAVSVFIECESEKEIHSYYKRLSDGGKKTQPIERTFWDAFFGSLTDKYGNHWLLNYTTHRHE